MTTKERATNLQENYCELRGYSYLFAIFYKHLCNSNILDNDVSTAFDSLSSFITQKIDDLEYDIEHLCRDVMGS